jgi:hypothetical protein
MATAAPHVKLLRQLASAKDDYLSGAFDISWDGAKATLYLVFGRPSHAVFETDQAQIEGEAAIDALLAALPRTFVVSDWRRAMSPQETLSITIDELAGPFVRLAGSYADDPVVEEDPEWWSSADDSPDLAFGLADFPLLPGGRPLWAETSPENVHLAEQLAELPPSILILTGAKLRAAAVVSGGDLIDAVWIDDADVARGETAGMALLGATKGSLAGYALDDPRVAEALTMLWRLPVAVSGVELSWLDPASMLAAFRSDGLDRVLVIDAPVRGIALFSRGGLVAVYSETQRSAVASPERLRSLLSQARGRLTVMERKPRPLAAEAEQTPVSATQFFHVVPVEGEPEAAETAEAEPVAAETEVSAEQEDTAMAQPVADHTDTADGDLVAEHHDEAGGDFEAAVPTDAEPAASASPAIHTDGTPPVDDGTVAEATAAPGSEAAPSPDANDAETTYAHVGELSAVDEAPTAEVESSVQDDLPPPPPSDDAVAVAHELPPPPTTEAAEPEGKRKRGRWGFGRKRKNRDQQSTPTAEQVAADTAAEAAEAATFAGWNVRQPNAEPQPVWLRSHDGGDDPGGPPAEDATATAAAASADEATTPTYGYRVHTDAPAATSPDETPGEAVEEPRAGEPASLHVLVPEDALDTVSPPPDVWHYEEAMAPAEEPPHSDPAHDAWSTPSWLDDAVSAASSEPHAVDASTEAPHAAATYELSTDQPQAALTDDASTEPPPAAATGEAVTERSPAAAADEAVADSVTADAPADHEPVNWSPFSWSVRPSEHDLTPAASETEDAPAAAADQSPSDDEHAADHELIAATSEDEHGLTAGESREDELEPNGSGTAASDPDAGEPDAAAADGDALPARKPGPVLRTPGPWSWPLAEHDEPPALGAGRSHGGFSDGADEIDDVDDSDDAMTLEPATVGATRHEDSATAEHNGEQGFFNRDEPVGSQYVDFDEVRSELVQIGVVWLGEANSVPVTKLLLRTRSTIDDFVATIDTIRGLHIEGQDPASIQAMAREMHQQAAERLCGA